MEFVGKPAAWLCFSLYVHRHPPVDPPQVSTPPRNPREPCATERIRRVNAISAGPIKTLAASAVSSLKDIFNMVESNSPLRRNVTTADVGGVAAFLASDLAHAVTGQVIYVDSGFSKVGATA